MSWFSIYIPRISREHTVESIKWNFNIKNIGIVTHIDFTPINKKPGFGEKVDEVVISAFVHFEDPWKDISLKNIRNLEFWGIINNGQPYKLHVSSREYWLCLKNRNPIQRTLMNIHQVVENGRHLEGLIEAQAKTIQEQAEKIEALERKLESTDAVVGQLISGLFNLEDQSGICQLHMDILSETPPNHTFKDSSKWGIWPTTHQGNECERKIYDLEKNLYNLENILIDKGFM